MSFFGDVFNWFSGNSIGANLAKTAILGYTSKLLSKNSSTGSGTDREVVDPGVRLQINPSTDNKIPVLYGEAYFGGYITDAQISADYKTMTYCLTLAEVTGNKLSGSPTAYTFKSVYLGNNRVVFKADGVTVDYTVDATGNQDISMRDLVKVYLYKEQTGIAPRGSGASIPAPSTVMPGWTAGTHPMSGLIYAIVKVQYNKASGVSGLPECLFNIATDMTLPGDVLNDYMTNTRYGAGIASADIVTSSLTDLNEFATTGFTYKDPLGVTQTTQITVNGLVDTQTEVLTNMEELAKAASSWMSYDIHQGKWKVVINRASTSTASFTDSNIIGEISVSGTALTSLYNVADVKFQNTDILDKTDFAKITIPAEDLYQNEILNTMQMSLAFTNKQAIAIKLGLQELKQGRVDKIISFTADYSYINITAGDLIDVTSDVYGFTNKMFRVVNVQETEDESGALNVAFQCLEYDADVYAYDIQEYEVETDDGILGIGSIGKPDTPIVTKVEQANVPKLIINAEVPSGIVDSIEFWITFDVSVPNDVDRTYIQIGSYSNPAGTLLGENQSIFFEYSNLGQSDFFVKVRGANSMVKGPYSDPTGLIKYVPIVVADTLSDTPVSIGGQLMTLGMLTLLNNLDEVLKVFEGKKGLFDAIFGIFKNETGYDLVGETKGGNLVVASNVGVSKDGTTISTTLGNLNFTGPGVGNVTANSNVVTVSIPGIKLTDDSGLEMDENGNVRMKPSILAAAQNQASASMVPHYTMDPQVVPQRVDVNGTPKYLVTAIKSMTFSRAGNPTTNAPSNLIFQNGSYIYYFDGQYLKEYGGYGGDISFAGLAPTGKKKKISLGFTTPPKSIYFTPDGMFFMVSSTSDYSQQLRRFALTTAWDISTISDTSTTTYQGNGQIAFSYDGRYLYDTDTSFGSIRSAYYLNTPWDPSGTITSVGVLPFSSIPRVYLKSTGANQGYSITSNRQVYQDSGSLTYGYPTGTSTLSWSFNSATSSETIVSYHIVSNSVVLFTTPDGRIGAVKANGTSSTAPVYYNTNDFGSIAGSPTLALPGWAYETPPAGNVKSTFRFKIAANIPAATTLNVYAALIPADTSTNLADVDFTNLSWEKVKTINSPFVNDYDADNKLMTIRKVNTTSSNSTIRSPKSNMTVPSDYSGTATNTPYGEVSDFNVTILVPAGYSVIFGVSSYRTESSIPMFENSNIFGYMPGYTPTYSPSTSNGVVIQAFSRIEALS